MFRVTCPVKQSQLTKLAKLMYGVRILVPPRVRFLIVHQAQQFDLMIRVAVADRAFDLANLRVEHAVMTRPAHQLDRSRMFVAMTPRVRAEQVAPAEFRLVLMTRKVVPSPVVVPVQPPSVDRVRVPMRNHVNVVNAAFRHVLVLLVAICQRQSQLAC